MIGEWRLSDLQSALGGELPGGDALFTGVSTDTRSIKPGNLFLALKGPNFDGHRFIEQALNKGAVAVVVSEQQSVDIPQWLVDDTHTALGLIGKLNRQRFGKPVFAVTGSAGKTTVKEMLAAILSQQGEVLATRGNLNNDIGGPLTLMEIEEQHQHAVIELGASAENEIAYTVNLTLPDVAILTNAMGAHLEGFGTLQGVVRAKGEIFDMLTDSGWAIINRDDPHADDWLDKTEGQNRLTFGIDNDQADVVARHLQISENGCYHFLLEAGEQQAEIQLGVMGKHNVANATAACAAIIAAGLPLQLAVAGLEKFTPVKGRMCPQVGVNGATVIDDSYNANPGAVRAAVDLLTSLPGKHLLLLGDMAELGDDAAEQHADVGSYAAQKGTDRLMTVGALSLHAVEAFNAATGMQGGHFETREQMVDAVRALLEPGMTVLVKGSRSAGMEKVVAGLVEGNH